MKKLVLIAIVAFLGAMACENGVQTNIQLLPQSDFDTVINDKAVTLFTLQNASGMTGQFTNYGATIVALWVKDKSGTYKDVVWGYETIGEYVNNQNEKFSGPIVGRFGNRINRGMFSIDSVEYQLDINDGPNHLHGGKEGFYTKVWNAKQGVNINNEGYVTMSYISPDGEQGYPGELITHVTYTLKNDNSLEIKYDAVTDRTTIVNLTSHAYFNLHGTTTKPITSHLMQINAKAFTPTDSTLIPTGAIELVADFTPMDFRKAKPIGRDIGVGIEPIKFGGGYDHNWILDKKNEQEITLAAEVYEPETGIVMSVLTDQPAIQFYSGNFMNGVDKGKRGETHDFRTGMALETQNYPDAPNHSHFPSALLLPGDAYTHTSIYTFGVRE